MGIPIHIVGEGIDWPAWIQAVGSVAALIGIFVAQRIDHREVQRQRASDATDRTKRENQSSVTAAKFVVASIAGTHDAIGERWVPELIDIRRVDLSAAIASLRDIDRGSLPSEDAVVAVVNLLQAGHTADLLLKLIEQDLAKGLEPRELDFSGVKKGAEKSLAQLVSAWRVALGVPLMTVGDARPQTGRTLNPGD